MSSKPPVQSDLSLLVPAFRERVEGVLALLRHIGHEPFVWETLRSQERARWLVANGSGRTSGLRSMHLHGLAVDVICGRYYVGGRKRHMWSCRGTGCDFFPALVRCGKAYGLISGTDWDDDGTRDSGDWPHLQGVPLHHQAGVRAAPFPAVYGTAVIRGEIR